MVRGIRSLPSCRIERLPRASSGIIPAITFTENKNFLHTIGQPRVGNQAFAMNFMGLTRRQDAPTSYYRVVHAQDPIPHVPPILLGFWHAPTEVFYNEEQTKYEVWK
jgi:hypothetical protein